MHHAALKTCEDISGAKFGYVQSDECSILMHDRDAIETEPWFDNKLQKIVSVAASIYTAHFNSVMFEQVVGVLAYFDARAFILPPEEVVNYFIWRQQDATRNSISGLAHSKYGPRQLHAKNSNEMQDMLMLEHGINWNDLLTHLKRGASLFRKEVTGPLPDNVPEHVRQSVGEVTRNVWHVDLEMPILTQDRKYVTRWL